MLFADACRIRRQIALCQSAAGASTEVLFVKHHRALFNHMCDQYYGMCRLVRAAGSMCLSGVVRPSAQKVRDVLADSVVQSAAGSKGQKLFGGPTTSANRVRLRRRWGTAPARDTGGGSFLSPDLSFDGKSRSCSHIVECRGDMRHHHHTDPIPGTLGTPADATMSSSVNVDGTGLDPVDRRHVERLSTPAGCLTAGLRSSRSAAGDTCDADANLPNLYALRHGGRRRRRQRVSAFTKPTSGIRA